VRRKEEMRVWLCKKEKGNEYFGTIIAVVGVQVVLAIEQND
jgi:hypothetical protein